MKLGFADEVIEMMEIQDWSLPALLFVYQEVS